VEQMSTRSSQDGFSAVLLRRRAGRGGLGRFWCVEAENGLALFHHTELVAGDHFDVFGIVLQKVHLARSLFLQQLLGGEFGLFGLKLCGQFVAPRPLGMERQCAEAAYDQDDRPDQQLVNQVPDLGIFLLAEVARFQSSRTLTRNHARQPALNGVEAQRSIAELDIPVGQVEEVFPTIVRVI